MRLKDKYKKEVVPVMQKKFGYKNKMAAPKIEKIVLNTGFGKVISQQKGEGQKKIQEGILRDLSLIAGQKAILTCAKKSIAGFKLREGQPIGAKVVLRKDKMWDFMERVVHIALPRSRDFQGIDSKSIDQKGNLTFAFREHLIFPEIAPEKVSHIFSFEVTIVTMAKSREEGIELLKLLGFPITGFLEISKPAGRRKLS
jgi:large subunit ribosomal protein L5